MLFASQPVLAGLMVGANTRHFDCRCDETLAAFAAVPTDLTFRHTFLIRHQKNSGFLRADLYCIRSSFGYILCHMFGVRRNIFRFLRIGSRSVLLRLHTPEDPPVAGMSGDGHPGTRRTLEFPATLQAVAELSFGILYDFAGVTLFVVPAREFGSLG